MKKLLVLIVISIVSVLALAQQNMRLVQGRVVNADGMPLEGVAITVANYDQQAMTDVNGNFSIKVPFGYRNITASCLDYFSATQEIDGSFILFKLKLNVDAVKKRQEAIAKAERDRLAAQEKARQDSLAAVKAAQLAQEKAERDRLAAEHKADVASKVAAYNEKYKNKGIANSIDFGYVYQFAQPINLCYDYSGYRTYNAINPVFVTYTLSYKINHNFSIGAGTGAQFACQSLEIVNDNFVGQWAGFKEKRIDVPVFANVRMSFCRTAVRPFVNLRGGYYVLSGRYMAEGGLGIEYRLTRSVGINLQTAFSMTPYPVDAKYQFVPSLSVKLGLDF